MRDECGSELACRAQAFLYFKAIARGGCFQWQKLRKHYGCSVSPPPASAAASASDKREQTMAEREPPPELTNEIREPKLLVHYPVSDPTDTELHVHYFGEREETDPSLIAGAADDYARHQKHKQKQRQRRRRSS